MVVCCKPRLGRKNRAASTDTQATREASEWGSEWRREWKSRWMNGIIDRLATARIGCRFSSRRRCHARTQGRNNRSSYFFFFSFLSCSYYVSLSLTRCGHMLSILGGLWSTRHLMGDACLRVRRTTAYWLTKNNKDGSVMCKSSPNR